jgi:hypothetical protein
VRQAETQDLALTPRTSRDIFACVVKTCDDCHHHFDRASPLSCQLLNPTGSRTWSDFTPLIKPSVTKCPEAIIESATRLAAIDFCRRADVLAKMHEIDTQRFLSDYFLETEDCVTPIRILSVSLANSTGCCTPFFAPAANLYWTGCCGGYRFSSESPTHIRISPTSTDTVGNLKVTQIVAPSQDSCKVDDFLYDQWREAISFGALARLHGMQGSMALPNRWYSPNEALKFARMFRAEINRAKTEVARNYSSGPVMARARRWM